MSCADVLRRWFLRMSCADDVLTICLVRLSCADDAVTRDRYYASCLGAPTMSAYEEFCQKTFVTNYNRLAPLGPLRH